MLLIGSGWDIDRVLRVVAHRVNGVRNAPEASGPTPSVAPEFRDFRRVASLMRDLERRRELDIAYRRHGSSTSLVLRFSPADHGDLAQTELKRLLGVNLDLSECAVVESPASPDRDEVVLLTRSLLGAMFYLSQSVETPRADREHGLVPITRDDAGEVFDRVDLTGDLLRIRSDSHRPERAFVAVPYRGSWFYLADDDLSSKSTFGLLAQLFNLQAGDVDATAPVLTLPVGN